jgi:hypothetical protein
MDMPGDHCDIPTASDTECFFAIRSANSPSLARVLSRVLFRGDRRFPDYSLRCTRSQCELHLHGLQLGSDRSSRLRIYPLGFAYRQLRALSAAFVIARPCPCPRSIPKLLLPSVNFWLFDLRAVLAALPVSPVGSYRDCVQIIAFLARNFPPASEEVSALSYPERSGSIPS